MVRQVQVTSEIGLTFASALRSVLRQDPDVILVGEIRDQETAKIAVQAALTGHLVLSTLHTNDAVGAIARLRDLDVPAFAVVNALLCSLAQRLAKRVCEQCAVADPGDARLLASMGLSAKDAGGFRIGTGCAACANSGVRGRLGVFEIMRMSHRLQGLTEALASPAQLRAAAIHEGMRSMWHDGLDKARLGQIAARELLKLRTSFDEAEAADPIRDAA
jgi:type IV pilus assembly protein PilB